MADKLGKNLKPSTVQTVYDQLEFQRVNRPSWIAYHFPEIDKRGRVGYDDVEGMSEREADSVRQLLASQISFGRKQIARHRARGIGFTRDADEENGSSEWEIRNKQMEEALADLCAVYGMTYPL